MTRSELTSLRLHAQQISDQQWDSPEKLLHWMGAVQAQDFNMAKWATGLRLPKATQTAVEDALDQGQILRTHILRPTWHLVARQDIRWMLDFSAPRIKAGLAGRHKELELDTHLLAKAKRILENVLKDGEASRNELKKAVEDKGIHTSGNRMSHLLMEAELSGLICSGRANNYALLDERVPPQANLTREEALNRLTQQYFQSHGPALESDFAWWAGINLTEARKGIASAGEWLSAATVNNNTYYFKDGHTPPGKSSSLFLLPAFDEYFIAYTERSTVIDMTKHAKAASNNGIFWPLIVQGGQVAGTWKREFKGDKVLLETQFFNPPSASAEKNVLTQARKFARFLGKKPDVTSV